MTPSLPHISVCICTYRRPELLRRLLSELSNQQTGKLFTYSIVVVDNDALESARPVVTKMDTAGRRKITYCVESCRNIALARNRALVHSCGDFIAFIDDDEYPAQDWLLQLFETCVEKNVDGVLGPVLPTYNVEPPTWVKKGRFYDRPRHETGFIIGWTEGRTGNLLFKRSLLDGSDEVFKPQFGSGGEDRDMFRRWIGTGRKFAWCDEAIVFESIPALRWKRSFLLRRALLRGKMSLGHSEDRVLNLFKSLLAVPLYLLALPFLCLAGHHLFMKSLVSLFDHLGRLLAWLNIRFVGEAYVTE
jgi:glycosyltransferase involved in cell wall biosynthesis